MSQILRGIMEIEVEVKVECPHYKRTFTTPTTAEIDPPEIDEL